VGSPVRVRTGAAGGCDSSRVNRLLATRTQVALLAVALVAALGVLGAIGWVTASARAAALVTATWQPDCADARVGRHQGEPAILSRPGWRCEIDVRVVNDSDSTIRVTGVSGRKMGLEGEVEARALPSNTSPLQQNGTSGADATWDSDVTVPPHSARTVTVAIGWRPEGCNGAGLVTLRPWATVSFDALEREHQVTSTQPLVLRTFDDRHDRRACPPE